ncbi:MAG: 3-oxoacyl-ACP reductase family protein [Candidatus Geothermincolia bacterium]
MKLDGKVALVTGASRGIGRAISLALAEEGAGVAVNYQNSADLAQDAANAIESNGGRAIACGADVSDMGAVREMVRVINDRLGNIDILVNNAGIVDDGLMPRLSEESWNRVLAVNLTGSFNCTKVVIPAMMRQRWGRIINVSSAVALLGNAGQANYVSSKAGLLGLTKAVAREYSSRNILANAVCPGYIRTDMTAGVENLNGLEQLIPLGRVGSCEEVARAVVFLATSATYTTGAVLDVSGGLVM